MKDIQVTTTDLHRSYQVIGPVYYQVSNKGFFTSTFSKLIEKYKKELEESAGNREHEWNFTYGKTALYSDDRLDRAFYVAVRELKQIVLEMGADAIIGMRQDVSIEPNSSQYFYFQVYGTAVKFN